MNVESLRAYLLKLPHVAETMQWGDNLVYWVGDKAIGGKMFVFVNLDGHGHQGSVISYAAGSERYTELLEMEGLFPAPYLARAYWIAAKRWDVFRPKEWEQELRAAYELTFAKLTPKTRKALELPAKGLKALIAKRQEQIAAEAGVAKETARKISKKAAN